MRLHRFYLSDKVSNDSFDITDKELVHQWRTVFRYNVGSQVIIFDGLGFDYLCLISSLRSSGATVSVIRKTETPGRPKREVTLCLALIKKDNFEMVVQKATEIGVCRVIPVLCERTEKKNINMERLQKISVEASEQSGRKDLPVIGDVIEFKKLIESDLLPNTVVALNLEGGKSDSITNSNEPIAVFIGPEGGFSEVESEYFKSHNIITVSLGTQVLRAETAAIAISSLLLL